MPLSEKQKEYVKTAGLHLQATAAPKPVKLMNERQIKRTNPYLHDESPDIRENNNVIKLRYFDAKNQQDHTPKDNGQYIPVLTFLQERSRNQRSRVSEGV